MGTLRFGKLNFYFRFALKTTTVLLCVLAVGCMNHALDSETARIENEMADIVPPTAVPTESDHDTIEFTLDAEMMGTLPAGTGPVTFVEYRGNPNYRILQIDEQQDQFEVLYQIPKGHLIYSLTVAHHPDQLLIAYTQNAIGFDNGIYLLDLTGSEPQLVEILPEQAGTTYTDISMGHDGTFWVTKAETAEGKVAHSIAEYDMGGNALRSVPDVITPVVVDDRVYFLPLEDDNARRKIGYLDAAGEMGYIDVLAGQYDLDDFLFVDDALYVAVLNRHQQAVKNPILDFFSSPVAAHGNHTTPATWVKFDATNFNYLEDADWGAKIIYDSTVLQNGQILEITNEGLEIIDEQRKLIIKSRALRLAAD